MTIKLLVGLDRCLLEILIACQINLLHYTLISIEHKEYISGFTI